MAVLTASARIEGPKVIKALKRVRIILSREEIDVAEVEFPFLRGVDLSVFRKGEELRVYLGNNVGENMLFFGKITWISPNQPLKIRALDWVSAAMETRYTKVYEGELDYADIAEDAIKRAGLEPKVIRPSSAKAVNFRVDNHTVLQVLERCKEMTGFDLWAIPGTKQVYFGPPFPYVGGYLKQERRFVFRFYKNIIESELEYRPKEEVGKVIVYLVDSDFKYAAVKGEYSEGKEGPTKTFSFEESFGNNPQEAVKRAQEKAELLYRQLNTKSYTGSFVTFGNPFVLHSHEVRIVDDEYPERSGVFFVEKVVHEYGENGYKTKVYLGGRNESWG